jgi:hypothetical protein
MQPQISKIIAVGTNTTIDTSSAAELREILSDIKSSPMADTNDTRYQVIIMLNDPLGSSDEINPSSLLVKVSNGIIAIECINVSADIKGLIRNVLGAHTEITDRFVKQQQVDTDAKGGPSTK